MSDNQQQPSGNPKIAETDRLQLQLSKANRQTALSEAKRALAESELAEANYRNFVLQLYMKYGLTPQDAIGDNGEIIVNGAKQFTQGQNNNG